MNTYIEDRKFEDNMQECKKCIFAFLIDTR